MPTSSYVLLNGLRFHYLNWGGAGRPVVLLHGLASNARIWDFVAPRLAQAGLRVLALDQRSHGLSDPAPDGFDFATITRDLHAFLETLDLARPILVGHSWGASTVLSYAAARPAGPAGIVMVDGGLFALSEVDGMTWAKAEALLRPPDIDGLPAEDFLARVRRMLGGIYTDEIGAILLANFRLDEDERIYRRLPIPQHMQVAHAIYTKPTFDLFARVRGPVLVCPAAEPPRDARAEQFLALKRAGAARLAAHPNVTVRWFEDSIHDLPLQRPDALAETLLAWAAALGD